VDPVVAGDDVSYTVTVVNGGPDAAENVVMTDNLPGGVTLVSATPSQGTCTAAGGVVTCDLGGLANGASAEVTIVVNAPTAGPLTNIASASSDTADPNGGNNSDSETTTVEAIPVPGADLSVSKGDAVDPVIEGDDVSYTVTVVNGGPDAAENVVMTDNLPGGVTLVSATPSQGTCTAAGGVVTCDLGDLANGASAEVTIVVGTSSYGVLTNEAGATSDTADPNGGNNSDVEQTTVQSSSPPSEIVVDNGDPEFSTEGSWGSASWSGWLWYGTDLAYDMVRAMGSRATFRPNLPAAGEYEVSVWQVSCSRYCAPTAPYTVQGAGEPVTVYVDQGDTSLAGQWISLGVFAFEAGTGGSVVLSDDGANGRVIADAVRWVAQ
jgi:uncharacterized repeat protein (TIGR01451 family)